jgi:hypothetical protein
MSKVDDFLEGFGDALNISDPEELAYHYERWLVASELTNPVERTDIESGGYQTGLEAGSWYASEYLEL